MFGATLMELMRGSLARSQQRGAASPGGSFLLDALLERTVPDEEHADFQVFVAERTEITIWPPSLKPIVAPQPVLV